MKTVKAIVITADGLATVGYYKAELDSLRAVIGGGWLESVTLSPTVHLYCDEEGKLKGQPINEAASAVAHTMGWPRGDMLCGTVILLGSGRGGSETDIPEWVVDLVTQMADVVP